MTTLLDLFTYCLEGKESTSSLKTLSQWFKISLSVIPDWRFWRRHPNFTLVTFIRWVTPHTPHQLLVTHSTHACWRDVAVVRGIVESECCCLPCSSWHTLFFPIHSPDSLTSFFLYYLSTLYSLTFLPNFKLSCAYIISNIHYFLSCHCLVSIYSSLVIDVLFILVCRHACVRGSPFFITACFKEETREIS